MKTRKYRRRTDALRREKPFFSKMDGAPAIEAKFEEGFFQPKLTISKPGDRFEQEADKAAHAVVSRNRSGLNEAAAIRKKETVQRQVEQEDESVQAQAEEKEESVQTQTEEKEESVQTQPEEKDESVKAQADEKEESVQTQTEEKEESVQTQPEEKEETVQAQADEKEESVQTQTEEKEESVQTQTEEEKENVQAKTQGQYANPAFASRLKQHQGTGRPLPPKVRAEMEASLDADFSAVRIHTDEDAAQLSRMLGAQAFTRGNEIFFNEGQFNPESSAGKRLLAHELTHTKQQRKK